MSAFKPQAERQVRAIPKPQAERQVRRDIENMEGLTMRRVICNIGMAAFGLLGAAAMLFSLMRAADANLWGYAATSIAGLVGFLVVLILALLDLAESDLGHG